MYPPSANMASPNNIHMLFQGNHILPLVVAKWGYPRLMTLCHWVVTLVNYNDYVFRLML